jgi:transcriptional regulator with XRE-family HTH domain
MQEAHYRSSCDVVRRKIGAVNYRRGVAPALPADFWQTEPMEAALASGDLGQIIRAYRFHPFHGQPVPQDLVADWLHVSQSSLSRIEQGKRRVTISDLAGFARDLGIPMTLRWMPQDASEAGEDMDPFEPLEMVRRVERSELGPGALEALHAGAERLCCGYSTMPPQRLRQEAEQQLRYVRRLLDGRKTFSQHRELLVIAGWLSLLLGCLHNDMGKRRPAEAARDAAQHLGKEAGHPAIVRWACELHCWFALTDGRFRDVTRFAEAGLASLRTADSASVQLALQAAKGWAKLGDQCEADSALRHGSSLLNQLPQSEHPEHHFVFDPSKYEFYAAPIYEWLGEHDRAQEHCTEVFARCTAPDGTTAWPMRLSDTQNTMALVQLHRGDLSGAIDYGNRALDYDRKCIPSLLSSTSDVVVAIERQHPREPVVHHFRERVVEICREYGYQAPTAA